MAMKNRHSGGPVLGFDVADTGTLILGRESRLGIRGIIITNPSDEGIYLAMKDSPDGGITCQAEVGKGIYLTANGGAYESNENLLCISEIWAIHAAAGLTKRLCVQICR